MDRLANLARKCRVMRCVVMLLLGMKNKLVLQLQEYGVQIRAVLLPTTGPALSHEELFFISYFRKSRYADCYGS